MNTRLHRTMAALSKVDKVVLPFTLQSAKAINNETFRIVAHASMDAEYGNAEVVAGIAEVLGDDFQVLAETVDLIESNFGRMYSAIVTANKQVQAYDDKTVKGMKLITANVFRDDQDNIWTVSGDGDSRSLVMQSTEDYANILTDRLSRNVVTASYSDVIPARTGDYVTFYNTETFKVESGYYLHLKDQEPSVYSRQADKLVEVANDQIVAAYAMSDEEDKPYRIEAGFTGDLSNMLSYMKKLFANTEFYTRLEQLIGQRRSLGDAGGGAKTNS